MLKALQGYQPKQALITALLSILLWLPFLLNGISSPGSVTFTSSPLFNSIDFSVKQGTFLYFLLSLLTWLILAYTFLSLNRRHLFLETRSFLPFLFIMIGAPLNLFAFTLSEQTMATIFILPAIDKIFSSDTKIGSDYSWFPAGLWIGLASLLWLHAAIFLIVVFSGLILYRTFNIREWLLALLGFLTPWYFMGGIYYFIHLELNGLLNIISACWTAPLSHRVWETPIALIPLAFTGIVLIIASFHVTFQFQKMKLKNRKAFQILFVYFLLLLVLIILHPEYHRIYLPLLLIPASVPLTKYFTVNISLTKRILFNVLIFIELATLGYMMATG